MREAGGQAGRNLKREEDKVVREKRGGGKAGYEKREGKGENKGGREKTRREMKKEAEKMRKERGKQKRKSDMLITAHHICSVGFHSNSRLLGTVQPSNQMLVLLPVVTSWGCGSGCGLNGTIFTRWLWFGTTFGISWNLQRERHIIGDYAYCFSSILKSI